MCSWPLALSSERLLKQSYAGICSERKDCNGQAAEESWKTDHVAHLAGQGMKRRPEGPVNGEGPVYKAQSSQYGNCQNMGPESSN